MVIARDSRRDVPPARVPVSPTSAKPPHTIPVEFTDHAAAARAQKKWCLIMVYIKLNVILNTGLQFPDDLFAGGQLCQSQRGGGSHCADN